MFRHDLHILTGVYALDAVQGGSERDRFERHLRRCRACAGEVRGLAATATGLAMAAAAPPPPELRGRVLAAVARTRQLPPAVDRRARVPGPAGAAGRGWVPGRARVPGHGWAPRVAVAVAAVAVAVAAVLGVTQAALQRELDRAHAQSGAVAAVLAAPDARILARPTSAGGTATVVVSRSRHEMVVTTSGLPALSGGKVYELWLLGPPRVRPAGLLAAARAGHTGPQLASGLLPGDKFGLTVEPAGGTARPTTTPILVLSLGPGSG